MTEAGIEPAAPRFQVLSVLPTEVSGIRLTGLFGKVLKIQNQLFTKQQSFLYFMKLKAFASDKLTHYHTMPHFDALQIYSCGKHCDMEKEKIACDKQVLPFSQCFLPYMALSFHFKCPLKFRLQFLSIWTRLKFRRLIIG